MFDFTEEEKRIFGDIFKRYQHKNKKSIAELCIKKNKYQIIPWIRRINPLFTVDVFSYAGGLGNIEALNYLKIHKFNWKPYDIDRACSNGHIKVLMWFKENEYPWFGNSGLSQAVGNGYLEIVKWWIANAFTALNEEHLSYAIDNDQIEIMKYLVDNGCPLDPWAIASAAQQGSLDIVKYLREKGCSWDYNAIIEAEAEDHPEIAQWLRDNGCPTEYQSIQLLRDR